MKAFKLPSIFVVPFFALLSPLSATPSAFPDGIPFDIPGARLPDDTRGAVVLPPALAPEPEPNENSSSDHSGGNELAVRLANDLTSSLDSGDIEAIGEILYEVLYKFPGDPSVLLVKLNIAGIRSPSVQYLLARSFLRSGCRREEAVAMLRLITTHPERLPHSGSNDLRLDAANLLLDHEIVAASDEIWRLYRETFENKLLIGLAWMGDPRPRDVVAEKMRTPNEAYHNAELLGLLKIAEAAAPIDKILKFREDHNAHPDPAHIQAKWAMYQITGEKEHFDYLLKNYRQSPALALIARTSHPEVNQLLNKILLEDQTHIASAAFVGLYTRDPESKEVRDVVLRFFEDNRRNPGIGIDLILRVAAHLNDPVITEKGLELDARQELQSFRYWHNRRNWPVLRSEFL